MSVAEEDGGAGLGFVEEAVLLEELGRALYKGPYLSTIGIVLPALPAELQAEVAAGETSWTLAFGPLVPDLDTADRIAIVGGDGIYELEGAEREVLSTTDETRPLGVVRGGEPGRRLAETDVLEEIRSRSLAALAIEACGVARRALEHAIEHAASREQFGKRIGVYQAVSHPLADAYTRLELARSLALWAAWCVAQIRTERAGAGGGSSRQVVRGGGRGAGLRDGDPGARRDRLHLGARAPPPVQARALDRELCGVGLEPAGRGRGVAPGNTAGTRDPRRLVVEGLIMDYELNVPAILRRGEQLFGDREIVTRLPDRSWHRYTYADFAPRARRLAAALRNELGLGDGDRVATFGWNHYQHLETYLGVPVGGMVTHTLNLRLHPDDLTYIATHAGDRVLIADKVLWPLVENFRERVGFEHVVAVGDGPTPDGAIEYEDLLASAEPGDLPDREIDERAAAAMCYTSGTTGQPKGAVYSHRAIAVHSLACAIAGVLAVTEQDTRAPGRPDVPRERLGLPVHVHARRREAGLPRPVPRRPRACSRRSSRRRSRSPPACRRSGWASSQSSTRTPDSYDMSTVRCMVVGGSAAPQAMIEAFEKRHGLHDPARLGHDRDVPARDRLRADHARGRALRGASSSATARSRASRRRSSRSARAGAEGLVPWDGATMGELEVRGAWISSPPTTTAPEGADRWTDDGWFKTGDIVTIEPHGYIEIQDRSKDLVKSGGEWISTVALENALMGHPAVAEAAVIAVPDEKWAERPLAVVVLKEGAVGDRRGAPRVPRAATSRSGGCRSASSSSRRSRRPRSASSARRRSGSSSRNRSRREPTRHRAEESMGRSSRTEQDGFVAVVTIDHPP